VDFIINNWMLIAIALSSGGLLVFPIIRDAMGADLTPTQAVLLINRERAVVVDVCSAEEFDLGHVGHAKHIPLADLAQKLPTIVKNKQLPVIFVCQNGSRSASAARKAKGLGYEQAQSLGGGLNAWKQAGLPLEKNVN
jgi:rhodanese-related sulfurtransferase